MVNGIGVCLGGALEAPAGHARFGEVNALDVLGHGFRPARRFDAGDGSILAGRRAAGQPLVRPQLVLPGCELGTEAVEMVEAVASGMSPGARIACSGTDATGMAQ